MRTLFGDNVILAKNPEFRLIVEDEESYFMLADGHRVETDKLAKIIWDALPGTVDAVTGRVKQAVNVSERMIGEFLFLMVRAQLIKEESAGPTPSVAGANAADEAPPWGKSTGEPLPLVSVIVVTLNSEEHVRRCLESVFGLTYPAIEVIVVDNGSKDGTLSLIRQDFPQIRLFALGMNIFYTGGVNYGIGRARGDYFLILNDDVELEPDSLTLMMRRMRGAQDAGVVVPMLKFYHLRGFINGIGNHVRNWGWGSDNFIGFIDIGQFRDLDEVPSACVSAALVRRRAAEEVGLIDEKYLAYYEDVDWSFRFWLGGWRILAAADAVVYHKFGGYWKTMGRKLKLAARNRLRLVIKIFQGRIRLGFIKRYLKEDLRNILSLLKRREHGLVLAYARA